MLDLGIIALAVAAWFAGWKLYHHGLLDFANGVLSALVAAGAMVLGWRALSTWVRNNRSEM